MCVIKCSHLYGFSEKGEFPTCERCLDTNCEECTSDFSSCAQCKMYFRLNEMNKCSQDFSLSFTLRQNERDEESFLIEFDRFIDDLDSIWQDIIVITPKIEEIY